MHIHGGKVPYLSFKIFDGIPFVKSAVSTRHGGVSQGETYSSLNLGTGTADDRENIIGNYRRFCSAAGFDINRLVLAKQTHCANVRVVTESDAGKGVLRERDYDDVDALITNVSDLPLVIHTADCVPVALVDTKNRAIGNAHCGWRGTYASLAKIMLEAMGREFGTDPRDVTAAIGPCICEKCYEVSHDLHEEFASKFGYDDCITECGGRYYLNLPGINRRILIDSGVSADSIAVSDICTCCNCEDMFSHRGLGPKRGIIGSFLEIE